METPPKKIIWEFEVLRALAIIFVVLSHLDIMLSHINGCVSSDSYQAIIKAVSIPIGETGNCLFFFISGYLLYTNNGRITDLTRFYFRRFTRIYPQYLLVLLLFFHSSKDVFIQAAGLQGVLNYSNQEFWFIGAIVLYYLTYPLLVNADRLVHLIITACSILFGMVLLHYSLNLFFIGDILYYGVFVAGIVFAKESRYADVIYGYFKNHEVHIYGLMLLFASFAAALRYWKLTYVVASPIVMSMLFLVISISGGIAAYFAMRKHGNQLIKYQKIITILAYCSYSIYLIHSVIFSEIASDLSYIHAAGIAYDIATITALFISFSAVFLASYYMQSLQDWLTNARKKTAIH
ncbi:MAG TPA: acyltransferase [Methanothrix sp.]|nr:acyltransferase [Methanothrix sp.]HQJ79128.1 acyltransferase [Methanothrix sp.]